MSQQAIEQHVTRLLACRQCPQMIPPVVSGRPVLSPVMLIGQAPGVKEPVFGKPFAWTAGKTMFKWFNEIGLDEERFRSRVYMAAVCRCFPGKNPKGGDRVPGPDEIANCSAWMKAEFELLRPRLVIPVGKLAIAQLMPVLRLEECIGRQYQMKRFGHDFDVVPLPHPSGASTWHRMEPGKTLLAQALQLIAAHTSWQSLI
jgi:uracil-DNA glycosylase